MKILNFITNKKENIAKAQKYFDGLEYELVSYNYEILELLSDDIEEIAISRVKQAYNNVLEPCFTIVTGFYISALNGFPKTKTNFIIESIGIDGILKLLEDSDNREAYFKYCLAYYDGKDFHTIFSESSGRIAKKPSIIKGITNFKNLNYIFIPENCHKPVVEMNKEESKDLIDYKGEVIKKLVNYLKEK